MTRDRPPAIVFAIALTLDMHASVQAQSRVIYRGQVGEGNPACIAAAGTTGATYLLLAKPPEFRSIDSRHSHHLTVDDPPLGDDDVFLSGDSRYAVARSGAGTALLAGRSQLHQLTAFYQDRYPGELLRSPVRSPEERERWEHRHLKARAIVNALYQSDLAIFSMQTLAGPGPLNQQIRRA